LVLIIAAICSVSLLNLYSATHGTRNAFRFDAQVKWMAAGSIVFMVFTLIDYRALVRFAWIGAFAAIGLLLIVRLLGDEAVAKGSARWFNLGAFGVQPSEPAKIAVILALARMFHDAEGTRYSTRELVLRLALLGTPVVLIALQPDLGTASLTTLIGVSIAFIALPNVWPMVQATLVGLLCIPLLWETMHTYQKNRVLAFLDPSADPTGMGYHTRQSIFAVGSGQVWGKGFREGTQNQFDFLPEHLTDFPFSGWAEEWGFVGCLFVLALYAILVMWLLNLAASARDRAGQIICIGVAAMTFWHVYVNTSMVLGIAPVVGVTLPFISYGGSSVLTFFMAMGLAASVSLRRHGY
ncbi:MAG: rod shape-determining protein RodA, partial [Kofleriaceae bacterium]